MFSEQKVMNYLCAPFLFQIHDNKAINAFCLKYLVNHEALLSPSTFMSCCDHLRFHCSSHTSRLVADYFSSNGEIN